MTGSEAAFACQQIAQLEYIFWTLTVCTSKYMFHQIVGADRWDAFNLQPVETISDEEYRQFRARMLDEFGAELESRSGARNGPALRA